MEIGIQDMLLEKGLCICQEQYFIKDNFRKGFQISMEKFNTLIDKSFTKVNFLMEKRAEKVSIKIKKKKFNFKECG